MQASVHRYYYITDGVSTFYGILVISAHVGLILHCAQRESKKLRAFDCTYSNLIYFFYFFAYSNLH